MVEVGIALDVALFAPKSTIVEAGVDLGCDRCHDCWQEKRIRALHIRFLHLLKSKQKSSLLSLYVMFGYGKSHPTVRRR